MHNGFLVSVMRLPLLFRGDVMRPSSLALREPTVNSTCENRATAGKMIIPPYFTAIGSCRSAWKSFGLPSPEKIQRELTTFS